MIIILQYLLEILFIVLYFGLYFLPNKVLLKAIIGSIFIIANLNVGKLEIFLFEQTFFLYFNFIFRIYLF